jgi:AcrR family transcriptional regulator
MSDSDGQVAPDTRQRIMEATFRAVRDHGYKDLRLRDIGEEMDLSRQTIHYHYDGKYDLMSSFLAYIIDQYEGSVAVEADCDPWAELNTRIDRCLFGPDLEGFDHWDRMKVYHELYAHAQHDEEHRALFDEHYDRIRDSIVDVIDAGIEQGEFRDVDAASMGQLLTDLIHAARERRICLGHDDAPQRARTAIEAFVLDSLRPAGDRE